MPIYTCEADRNTVIHFGHGDVVVSTSADKTEVIITPSRGNAGKLGDRTDQFNGDCTATMPPGIRLLFDDPASALVLIDALSSVAQEMLVKVKARLMDYPDLCYENRRLQKMVELSKAVESGRDEMAGASKGPSIFDRPAVHEPKGHG